MQQGETWATPSLLFLPKTFYWAQIIVPALVKLRILAAEVSKGWVGVQEMQGLAALPLEVSLSHQSASHLAELQIPDKCLIEVQVTNKLQSLYGCSHNPAVPCKCDTLDLLAGACLRGCKAASVRGGSASARVAVSCPLPFRGRPSV